MRSDGFSVDEIACGVDSNEKFEMRRLLFNGSR